MTSILLFISVLQLNAHPLPAATELPTSLKAHGAADSIFIFSFPVSLEWHPKENATAYKLHIRINKDSLDTIVRNKHSFVLPENLLKKDSSAALLAWNVNPVDSKSEPVSFIAIIPAATDKEIVEQQLKQLRSAYSKDPVMLRLLEKDLFERWKELYQLH
ncbi:MAG: hypothetical protein GXC73_19970 [Chitinophagaceae bacterium]|nr:hypothetical protein [Chitinophagaceae bacterium]